jgi:hypothetical protein
MRRRRKDSHAVLVRQFLRPDRVENEIQRLAQTLPIREGYDADQAASSAQSLTMMCATSTGVLNRSRQRLVAQARAEPRVAVPLVLDLESELDRARAADLVEWVETAIRATRPQAARQRLRRVAERGAG